MFCIVRRSTLTQTITLFKWCILTVFVVYLLQRQNVAGNKGMLHKILHQYAQV